MTDDSYTTAVITANYYGFGNTEAEAIEALENAGGGPAVKQHGYILYQFDQPLRFEMRWDGGISWITVDGSDAPTAPDLTRRVHGTVPA